MKRLFILVVLFICSIQIIYPQNYSSIAYAETNVGVPDSSLYSYNEYADVLPQPLGGIKKCIQKIDYPLAAKASKTEGTVLLRAYINEKGEVNFVEIIKNIGFGCGEAAAQAIAKTSFIPATKNGTSASIKVVIPVKFQLYRYLL